MSAPTRELAHWHDRHRGARAVVAGCGPSVRDGFTPPADAIVIAVNDADRYIRPTYLLLIDTPRVFTADRLETIAHTRAARVFVSSAFYKEWRHFFGPRQVTWVAEVAKLDQPHPGWWNVKGEPQIHQMGGSPYSATSLAGFLGCTHIGLIGVDLGDHPRFRHELPLEEKRWTRLRDFLAGHGRELVNLSSVSALRCLPHVPLEEWLCPREASTSCA